MKGRLALLFSVLISASVSAVPHTFTVPQDYATIAAALSAANSGDTINVNPGTYTQALDFGGKTIALRSVTGPAVTIIQPNVSPGTWDVNISGAAEISGFTIKNRNSRSGIGIQVGGNGTLIHGNVFEDFLGAPGAPSPIIYANPGSPIIDGNLFRNNKTDVVSSNGLLEFLNGEGIIHTSPTIQNNVFFNNEARVIRLGQTTGSNTQIVNNTFVGNVIAISGSSASPTLFRNNIFSDNNAALVGGSFDPTWDHNLVYNSGDTYSGPVPNITAAPQFLSDTDFHLRPESPAIGAGSLTKAPLFDFDGQLRPASRNDIGAFTYVPEPGAIALVVVLCFESLLVRCRVRVFRPVQSTRRAKHI